MEREDAEASQEGPGRKQDRRRLPLWLGDLLSAKYKQGLDHVVRRRILRVLHASDAPFSSALLSDNERGPLSDLSLSRAAYHMRVLAKYEMVEETSRRPKRGALEHFFKSAVADDPEVMSVLAQTEGLDAPKRASGGEG